MTDLNSFTLAGNLTSDPKINKNDNGSVRTVLFTVAINVSKDKAIFIPVQLYGAQYTDSLRQKLVKGAGVILNGRVENISYQDQTGQQKTFFAMQPSSCLVGPRGSMNNGTVYGRLTRDPELRYTQNGTASVSFSIACNRSYKDKNGEWQDAPTSFLNVIAWEAKAELVCKYFRKGSPILIAGALQSRNYQSKTGEKRTAYEIVANSVSFAENKSDQNSDGKSEKAYKPKNKEENNGYGGYNGYGASAYSEEDFNAVEEDDIPF